MKLSVQERIEEKAVLMMTRFQKPSKAYLGKKEFFEINKKFKPIERVKTMSSDSTISTLHMKQAIITIIPTKHKSYLKVV